MRRKKNKLSKLSHDELVNKIKRHPEWIGLDNIVMAATEVECYDKRKKLMVIPDIIFCLDNGDYVAVEVKSTNSRKSRYRMEQQLENYYNFFLKAYGLECDVMGVYVDKGDLVVVNYNHNNKRGDSE